MAFYEAIYGEGGEPPVPPAPEPEFVEKQSYESPVAGESTSLSVTVNPGQIGIFSNGTSVDDKPGTIHWSFSDSTKVRSLYARATHVGSGQTWGCNTHVVIPGETAVVATTQARNLFQGFSYIVYDI